MPESAWVEWSRSSLRREEAEELLTALTPEQEARWIEHDSVWVEGLGVLWRHPDGDVRRSRFSHGAYFRTQSGEFYVDSEGGTRRLSDSRFQHPASAARTPLKAA